MDHMLSQAYAPFTFALGLMLALLALEVAALLLGLSLHGGEADLDISPEVEALQASFDLAPDADPDLTTLLEASAALHNTEIAPPAAGALDLLGLRGVPLMIWIASVLLSFGLGGYLLQGLASALLGGPLPVLAAIPVAAVAALAFSRGFAKVFARLVPRMETTATTAQFMGGLRGVVSQGTARKGFAAEVRLHDRHGNLHFLRAEPYNLDDVIPEGTEVLTLRERLGPDRWGLRILPLS
ncbi:MAG: OB-fold-containig protein [Cypionkella sp.]